MNNSQPSEIIKIDELDRLRVKVAILEFKAAETEANRLKGKIGALEIEICKKMNVKVGDFRLNVETGEMTGLSQPKESAASK